MNVCIVCKIAWTEIELDITATGTWSVPGDMLTYKLVSGSYSETYKETIKELTSTRMVTYDEDNFEPFILVNNRIVNCL